MNNVLESGNSVGVACHLSMSRMKFQCSKEQVLSDVSGLLSVVSFVQTETDKIAIWEQYETKFDCLPRCIREALTTKLRYTTGGRDT